MSGLTTALLQTSKFHFKRECLVWNCKSLWRWFNSSDTILSGVVFAMYFLIAAIDAGKLICYWNMTWMSYYALDGSLGNPSVYNTLFRVMTNYERMSTALVKLFNTHQVVYVDCTDLISGKWQMNLGLNLVIDDRHFWVRHFNSIIGSINLIWINDRFCRDFFIWMNYSDAGCHNLNCFHVWFSLSK